MAGKTNKADKGGGAGKDGIKIIAKNKKAWHEYEIQDTWEAGLVLLGTEVKALRNGRVNLGDSYGEIRQGEAWILKMHIGPYEMGNRENHEPFRPRKLLLNRREIRKILPNIEAKGLTLVPLKIYFKRGRVKLELGLGRGKKLHDKRETLKKRDTDRGLQRAMRRR